MLLVPLLLLVLLVLHVPLVLLTLLLALVPAVMLKLEAAVEATVTGQCQQTVLQRLQPHPNRLGTDIAHIYTGCRRCKGNPLSGQARRGQHRARSFIPTTEHKQGGHSRPATHMELLLLSRLGTKIAHAQTRGAVSKGPATAAGKRNATTPGSQFPTVKIVTNYHHECTVPPAPAPATAALTLFAALGRGARCGGRIGPGYRHRRNTKGTGQRADEKATPSALQGRSSCVPDSLNDCCSCFREAFSDG